jgi:hypothetical protein
MVYVYNTRICLLFPLRDVFGSGEQTMGSRSITKLISTKFDGIYVERNVVGTLSREKMSLLSFQNRPATWNRARGKFAFY